MSFIFQNAELPLDLQFRIRRDSYFLMPARSVPQKVTRLNIYQGIAEQSVHIS